MVRVCTITECNLLHYFWQFQFHLQILSQQVAKQWQDLDGPDYAFL